LYLVFNEKWVKLCLFRAGSRVRNLLAAAQFGELRGGLGRCGQALLLALPSSGLFRLPHFSHELHLLQSLPLRVA